MSEENVSEGCEREKLEDARIGYQATMSYAADDGGTLIGGISDE